MAEFKIDGRMTVRTLKENFKKEFEGTLRVYDGREKAEDNATLASIRKNDDVKGGELVCRASRTVGKFEKEMLEVFGIKVQVASPDDWVLALDGITLANLKNIKKNATKADMEELVAYKRKEKCDENNCVNETNTGVLETNTYKFVDFFTDEEIVIDYGEDFNETVFIGPLNNEEWALAKKNVIEDFYASCKKYYGVDVENIEFTDQEFTDFFNRYKECMEEGEDIEEVECKGLTGSIFETMAESIAKLYFYGCIGEIHFDYGYGMIDFTFELDLDNEEFLEGHF